MKEQKVSIDCMSYFSKNTIINMGMNISMMIALSQALQFVIDNKEEFKKKYSCDDCLEAIKQGQKFISDMIVQAIQYNNDELRKRES